MTEGQLLAYRAAPPRDQNGLGVESIEAWPAVGGGLLVGIAEPSLAGVAPQRRSVKTVFLTVDRLGTVTLALPYVALEDEARCCVHALVTAELALSQCQVDTPATAITGRNIIDVGPSAVRSIQACAAAARMLLLAAAAENWELPVEFCRVEAGAVRGVACGRAVGIGEIAPDAALCALPGAIFLRSGRPLDPAARQQAAAD